MAYDVLYKVRCTRSLVHGRPPHVAGVQHPQRARRYILSFRSDAIYLNRAASVDSSENAGTTMANSIRRWHRLVVAELAGSRWLRGRSRSEASWAHYERHARAWRASAERHATGTDSARAERLHSRSRERAQRLASHGPPRLLTAWQATLGRVVGATASREGQGR